MSTPDYREDDGGRQILPCSREDQHNAHAWRWHGRFIVADHWCEGLTTPASTPSDGGAA